MIMCQKVSFNSKQEASIRIAEIKQEDSEKNKKPRRSYKCPECGMWHLTSWTIPKKKYVSKQKFLGQVIHKVNVEEYYLKKFELE